MAVGPDEFFKRLEESGLLNDSILAKKNQVLETDSAEGAAAGLVEQKLLTPYQSEVLVSGDQIPLVVGDYVVTDSIGRGGMGYVLKARHRRMKRQVAIKFLLKSLTESDDLRRRFEREVEAAAQLDHQNIVTAYDAGIHEGSHYLVMQYVDGDDLSRIVKSSGPLSIPKAVDVIRQAAQGLGYAHDQGIVHRDIKPGNLLLDGDGVVRILDMGLARMSPSPGDALEGGAQADLTNTGSVMGTIDYMAPEQALDAKSVDARADLYALGCTLYFLVTGNPPFRNDTVMRRLLAHREQPAPRITEYRPEAPSELDQVFATMMSKSPEDRYPSMKHLVVALDSLGLNDTEDEQMATMDMPDDGSGGFISVSDEDDLGLSELGGTIVTPGGSSVENLVESGIQAESAASRPVDESSTGSVTRKLPNFDATMLEPPSHASAMNSLENVGTTSPDAASPDTDFTGVGETIIGDSQSVAGAAAARAAKSPPPWKLIVPAALAVVALIAGIVFKADTPVDSPIGTIVLEIDEANAIGAVVTVDGQKKMTISATGKESIEITADEKSHSLLVAKGGFEPFATDFTVARGEQKLISVRLVKAASEESEPGRSESAPHIAIARWQPGPSEDVLPGRVRRPAKLPGIFRWQLETAYSQNTISFLAYSPDGLSIACGARYDNALRIYDAKTLVPTQVIGMVGAEPRNVAWSPDSNWLAASVGIEVRLWKRDGTPGHVLKGHKSNVLPVAWSSDGMWLASGSQDGMIRLWDADGNRAGVLEGHTGLVRSIAFSPDSKRLASVAADKTVRFWGVDGTSGQILKGHTESAESVAWSPDGQTLATFAEKEQTVRIWDVETGAAGPTIKSRRGSAWSPDGNWLAAVAVDAENKVLLWRKNGTQGPELLGFNGHIFAFSWSPDSSALVVGGRNGSLGLLRVNGTNGPSMIRGPVNLRTLAWSSDGKRLASGHGSYDGGGVRVWTAEGQPTVVHGESRSVSAVAWNPNSNQLATAGGYSGVHPVNIYAMNGRLADAFAGHKAPSSSLAWRHDGEILASGSTDTTVRLWKRDGAPGLVLNGHEGAVSSVAWSPDGKWLASRGGKTIRLWSVDGNPGPVMEAANVASLGWSPDSRTLASVNGRQLQLWNPDGTLTRTFPAIGSRSLAWKSDGKTIIVGSDNAGATYYEVESGDIRLRLPNASVIALSPDDQWLTTGKMTSGIQRWNATTGEPDWLALCLTEDESVTLSAAGQVLFGNPQTLERELVYLVERHNGRIETLKYSEFQKRVTPQPIAPAPMSLDRRAAEWVLSVGGKILIEGEWGPVKELPSGPFQLRGANLTDSAATNEELVNLRGLTHLKSINLLGTQITDQGLAVLTDSGRVPLPSLDSLDLQGQPISDDGIGYLAGSDQLRQLNLNGTRVSDLAQICREFPQIFLLTLAQTSVTGDSLVHLETLRRLKILKVNGSQLRGGGRAHIAILTGLKSLNVSNASDGFESDVLTKLTNLDDLRLAGSSENQLDGRFWSTVSALPRLTNITLEGPGTTSTVMDQMPVLKQLRQLTIKLTSASGAAIANAVKKQPQLKVLHLDSAALDDADAKLLESLTVLTELGLKGNLDITVAAIESLHKALPDCRIESDHGVFGPDPVAMSPDRGAAEWVLSVGGSVTVDTPDRTKVRVEDRSELPIGAFVLKVVDIQGSPHVTDEGLMNLRGCSQLVSFNAWDTAITNQGLANLTEEGRQPLRNLQNLHLARTAVTDTGLRYLVGSKDLVRLEIASTLVSDGSLLRNFLQLYEVGIEVTKIPAEDLSVLRELPLLRKLSVDGGQLRGVGSRHVASLDKLTTLMIWDPGAGFDGTVLSDLQELTRLTLVGVAENQTVDEFWSVVASLSKLDSLDLSGEGVADASIARMPAMAKLRVLKLSKGKTKLSGETLAAAVTRLPALEELSVTYRALSDADAEQLESLTQLAKFTLMANEITAAGVASLREALPNCQIYSDHGVFGPDPAIMSPDRRAAEVALKLGGSVTVRVASGETFQVAAPAELPTVPFVVTDVVLVNLESVDDDSLTHFRGLNDLYNLTVTNVSITDRGLANLTDAGRQPLLTLRQIILNGTDVSQDGLEFLSGSRELHSLLISDTAITSGDVLGHFPKLTMLNVARTSLGTDELRVIRKLPQVEHLAIDARHFAGETATDIAELSSLHTLALNGASDFESSVLSGMESLKQLSVFDCAADAINGAFWNSVAGLRELEKLMIKAGVTDQSLAEVSSMPQLRRFAVSSRSVSGTALAKAMSKFPNVTTLEVSYSNWSDDDVQQLHGLKTLRELDLTGNPASAEAIKALSAARPDCRILSDHGTFGPPAAAMTPDRHAAEVALELGGSVSVRVASGETLQLQAPTELPTTPFVVTGIILRELESVDDDSLTHFQGLNDLLGLTLSNDSITDRGLANLTDEGRQPLPALLHLYLDRTDVSQDGLQFLSSSPELQRLTISGTAITDANVLGQFPKLGMLYIDQTSIETNELKVFRKLPELGRLHIDARHFSGETANDIADLSRLRNLSLLGASSFESSVLSRMESLNALRFMSCAADAIDSAFWKSVAGLQGLETLSFVSGGVTDQSLAEVSSMPQLREFAVTSKSVSGLAVAKAMSKFPNVTSLQVTYSGWSDDDVQQLHGLKSLRELYLTGNKASAEAIKALSATLPGCRIISDHGTFGPPAAAMTPDRHAAEVALELGGTVSVRVASGEMLQINAPAKLPTTPFVVTKIILRNLQSVDDDSLTHFRGLNDLIDLNVANDSITDRGLANLTDEGRQPLPALRRFYLDGTDVSQDGLQFLSGSRELQGLLISATAITRGDVLGQFPKLGMLSVALTSLETDELRVIRKLPQVANLNIDARHFSGETAIAIADLSKLNKLVLHGASGFESSTLPRLESLKSLGFTECASDAFDGAFWKSVAGLRELESLSFKASVTDQSLAEVSSMPQLRSFEVTSRSVSGTALAKAMSKFPNVASLKVTYSDWSDDDVQQLHGLKTLRELDLTGNPASVEAIKALSAALPDCRIISAHGTFGPPAVAMPPDRRAAEAVLKLGGSVTVMDSAGSVLSITDPVELPAEPLAVTEINLLGKPGVDDASLANFRGLTALRKLILTRTMITDRGLSILTNEGREPLQTLQLLYLDGTDISQDGLQFLSGSTDLGSLFLSETALTDAAVLVRFPGLTSLNTEGTALKAGDMDVVASLPLLGQLQMDGHHFFGSTVDHIAGLPNLTHLNLFELPVNIDMSAFARLPQVTKLLFYSPAPTAFDDEFWKAIATLEKLESLTFAANVTGELFTGALPMPQLRDLIVQSGHVRGSTVAKAMSRFPNLTFLEVRHSAWTDEDVRLLHDFKSLRQLNLPGNNASAEAIKALFTALPACTIESDHGTFEPTKTE